MYKNIFLDANIILDIFDVQRPFHVHSVQLYSYALNNNINLLTSCDIITTLYYINAKQDKNKALQNILNISKTLKIIEFSNKEVEESCTLMMKDKTYNDLEDTIQYILAKKMSCDIIISNDKKFISKNIKLFTSKTFCEQLN